MSKLTWDASGEKFYETGVDRGVVYPQTAGTYPAGEAWNGLTAVNFTPSGAEATPLYANNHKYLELRSLEELGFTIEAYTYPDSFAACNGYAELATGAYVTQQKRKAFGFTCRTLIGNDTEGTSHGYKLHLIYGAMASPSEDSNATVNDSPEAKTMSWECTTTPVEIANMEPSSHIEIDSTKATPAGLAALEAALYGTENEEAYLPMPDEVLALLATQATGA